MSNGEFGISGVECSGSATIAFISTFNIHV